METRLFYQFLEVVKAQSFAGAARRLDLDPSMVSRGIAQLEADLGARLFQRTTRRLSLTEEGAKFLNRIEAVVDELELVRDELGPDSGPPTGKLSVSTSVAFGQHCILPLLNCFCDKYPNLDLDLKMTDANLDLVSEQIDLAIRLAPPLEINVVARKLMSTKYLVVASQEYLRQQSGPFDLAHLEKRTTICFDIPEFRDTWQFRNSDGKISKVPIQPRVVISNALGVKEAALRGIGYALLPEWLISAELERGELVNVCSEFDVTATDYETAAWLIYPSREYLPRRTRLAIDFFVTELGQ